MSDVITLRGKVGSAPIQVVTGGGLIVCNFSLATDIRQRDKVTQKWITSGTNWYRVAAQWHLSHNVATSLKVGDHVIVVGELRLTPWDNGVRKGTNIEIIADSIGHDLYWCTTAALPALPGSRRGSDQAEQHEWADAGTDTRGSDAGDSGAGVSDPDTTGGAQTDDGFLPSGMSGFASLES